MLMAGVTLSISVGPSQKPAGSRSAPASLVTLRPSTTILAPSASPASTYEATLSRCALVTSGPMSASRVPSPVLMVRARSAILATRSSAIGPTVTHAEIAMQRSPADPKPALTIASAARSRSASGRITAWFFAPPSACTRLPAAVPVAYTYCAIGVDPTKDTDLIALFVNNSSTTVLSPCSTLNTPAGRPASAHNAAIHSDAEGSFSDGLSTTVLPAAIAI